MRSVNVHPLVKLLTLVLVAEAAFLVMPRPLTLLTGPEVGAPLPAVRELEAVDGSRVDFAAISASGSACTIVVAASTRCGLCQQMRSWWPNAYRVWLDSIGSPVRALWVFDADRAALQQFHSGYDLQGIGMARVMPSSLEAFARWGVFSTPTTYLIDRRGNLRLGTLVGALPPADSARRYCSANAS